MVFRVRLGRAAHEHARAFSATRPFFHMLRHGWAKHGWHRNAMQRESFEGELFDIDDTLLVICITVRIHRCLVWVFIPLVRIDRGDDGHVIYIRFAGGSARREAEAAERVLRLSSTALRCG